MAQVLSQIRATRAQPPGRAATDPTARRTYGAALEQFDQLFTAATVSRAEAQPLLLFYALTQAGKAIAAAHLADGVHVRGHGLTETSVAEPISRSQVEPQSKPGLFGAMARLNDSGGLSGVVELGAVWAALPIDLPEVILRDWLPSMRVWLPVLYSDDPLDRFLGHDHRQYGVIVPPFEVKEGQEIADILSSYPGASLARPHMTQGLWAEQHTPFGRGYGFVWELKDAQTAVLQLHTLLPRYGSQREHWLIPAVGEGKDLLPPFLLWWILLFDLSLLARYQPAEWVAAVDPDDSELGVPLEELLSEALRTLPGLILAELTERNPTAP